MKHSLRIAVVAAMVLGAGAVVSARVPAHAVQGLQSAYWWQAQPDGAPLPAPPNVPANGLWVSGTDAAPSAIAAVRFQLADTEAAPALTLKVHSQVPAAQLSSASGVAPIVLACPSTKPWTRASAGAWNARPTYDCASPAHGNLSADGSTLTFDLGALVTNGTVDVVFVPGPGAAPIPVQPPALPGVTTPAQPSALDFTFEALGADAVHVSPTTPAGDTSSPDVGAATSPAPDLGTLADFGSVASPPAFNYAASAVQPSTGTAAGSQPAVAPGSLTPQLREVSEAALKENHGYRALAVILLGVLLWWAWRQATPPRPGRRTIYDGPPAAA